MTFKTAITKSEQLDAAKISTDDGCELGKWLHGDGRAKYALKPEFQKLLAAHKVFHQCAGKVATAINIGKKAEADAMLNGEFQSQSRETVTAIHACQKACV